MEVTRRDLFKFTGLAAAGVVGASALAGCAPKTAAETASLADTGSADAGLPAFLQAPEPITDFADTREYDIVVVGAGESGLSAAHSAVAAGAKVACVQNIGTAQTTGNMGASVDTTKTDEAGIQACVAFLMEKNAYRSNRKLLEAWARNSYEAVTWWADTAAEGGAESKPYDSEREYNGYTYYLHANTYNHLEGAHNDAALAVCDAVAAEGVEFFFNSPAVQLYKEGERVAGVICETEEGNVLFKASKGVILCTGGFEFNEELQAKYLKCYPMRGFYGWKYNTGDGITMAQKVGADLWHMQQVCGGDDAWFDDPEIVPGGVSVQSPTPNYIKVSRLGERWGNEEIFSPHGGWKPYANFDEEICDFDRIPSWYIFDQTSFDGGSWGGMVGGAATENGGMGIGYMTEGLDPELGGWAGWSADNKWELERGWITTGATLDELAANIAASKWDDKMDAEKLKASVARWNELCDKGADEDFGRQQLAKVETGPFYAIPLYPGICNTIGGARRNENANIVDPSGNPIPRLYSAGSFGNMNGHTYAITGGNGSENWCVGRIAGRNAAALEPWDAATEA